MNYIAAALLFGILIFIHELGHFIVAKLAGVKVLKFSLGFGPRLLGKKIGETEYQLSALPLGGYVKMAGEEPDDEVSDEDRARSFRHQQLWKKALIVIAGPFFNIVLTYCIFLGLLLAYQPVVVPELANLQPMIDKVEPDMPADRAGLKPGDRIIAIGDAEITTWFDIPAIIGQNPDKQLTLTVERAGTKFETTIIPQAFEEKDAQGKPVTIGRIGIRPTPGGFTVITISSPDEALSQAAFATYKMGMVVFDSIDMLITGKASSKALAGPVGIYSISTKAAEAGIIPYLTMMALISVNLGILNLLPIPVLDGGHIVFMTIESIRGKPLSDRAIGIAQRVGIALLVTLMVVAFYNDIVRLFFSKMTP
jgi:regulator of sigma E protease